MKRIIGSCNPSTLRDLHENAEGGGGVPDEYDTFEMIAKGLVPRLG